jgi:hypothetical protein
MTLFVPLFAALNEGGVRYVAVGGLATVLHGYARLTADVDLMVDLEPAEAERAMRVLSATGLKPRAPVLAEQFADEAMRGAWVRDKGMRVFSMWDPTQPMREVDVFVEHPIDFARMYERSVAVPVADTFVRIAAIDDLIALKRIAGRAQDQVDIEALMAIRDRTRQNV